MITTIAAGTMFGPYEVVSLLGAGGMGEVYRAKDTRLGRDVAVKVLPHTFASDPDRLRRFEQEARAAGMLNHPNILAVYDIGVHAGAPYVVSELLEGQTLRQRIDGSPMPPRKAVEIAAQFARGLAAAHDKGIVHRDLKPDNVFVTREGRVKILDFGLAKVAHRASAMGVTAMLAETAPLVVDNPQTEAGMILGTASYMSPEQIRAAPADHRSDIFSFGLVFYEMLTGRPAFRADSAVETMSAILKGDPPRMTAHAAELPPELERIVLHCLEKNPEERFQSAHDIAFHLDSMSGTSTAHASLPTPSSRGRLVKQLAVGAALLAAGVVIGYGARREPPSTQPVFEPLTFRRGAVNSARFAPDGKTVLYSAAWEGTPMSVYSAQPGIPESRSLDVRGAVRAVSRAGEMLLVVPRSGRPAMLAQLPIGSGAPRELVEGIRDADWTPNGQQAAILRLDGRLQFPIGTDLHVPSGFFGTVRVAPSGDRIAVSDHPVLNDTRGGVAVVDLQGEKTTLAEGFEDVGRVAWSPDGREVWFSASQAHTSSEHSIYAVSLEGKLRTLVTGPGHFGLLDVSPSGEMLVAHGIRRPAIVARSPESREDVELGWLDYSFLSDMSADGRRILFAEQGAGGGPGYAVYSRNTDGSPAVRLGKGDAHSLSADGRWALAHDLTTHTLQLLPTGAGQPRSIANHGMVAYPWSGFLPGDKGIVFIGTDKAGGSRMYIQDLDGGMPRPVTPEGVTEAQNTVSPDGKWLAARDDVGTRLYPIAGGAPREIPGIDPADQPVRWNADGSSLYVFTRLGPRLQVLSIDIATGTRTPMLDLSVKDPVGAGNIQGIFLSADGKSYAYWYTRVLQNLYVIKNVR